MNNFMYMWQKLYKNDIKKYYFYIIIRMGDLKIKGISYHERIPIAFKQSIKYPDKIYIYNGKGYDYMSKEDYTKDCQKLKYVKR